MGQVCERWYIPCRLQFQCILVYLYAVSLIRFVSKLPVLTTSHRSILGESKFSHAIPPVSVVSAELCWMTFMTFLTFLSSVLSTRIGPAKMCSSIPGEPNDPDAVSSLTN